MSKFGLLFFALAISSFFSSCSDDASNSSLANLNYNNSYQAQQEIPNTQKSRNVIDSKTIDMNLLQDDDMYLGSPNAQVKILFFFSTTCPGCALVFNNIFPKIKTDYIDKGKVLFIFREIISSQKELYASVLSRCSGQIEDYLKIMNIIFAHQNLWVFSKHYHNFFLNTAYSYFQNEEVFQASLKNEAFKRRLISKSYNMIKAFPSNYIPIFVIDGTVFDMQKYKNYKSLSQEIDKYVNKYIKLHRQQKHKRGSVAALRNKR